ncbi:MAG: phospho-sugar mutase, partial [Bdellovibrionota bacterium]
MAVPDSLGNYHLLSGNAIGALLGEYRILKLKELGYLPQSGSPRAAWVKTFVSSNLQEAIAHQQGLKCVNTLTGFKWIGEKLLEYENRLKAECPEAPPYDTLPFGKRAELLLKHSNFYVFGGEESYGYLASDLVRDKDANAAAGLFCELLASLKKQNKNVLDYLDEVYLKYGYFAEETLSIFYEGALGAQKIKNILESYRDHPPTSLGGLLVEKVQDFARDEIFDADGKGIPAEDFFFIHLSQGMSYAVRASGTEPKIKFYLFANGKADSLESLANLKTDLAIQLAN